MRCSASSSASAVSSNLVSVHTPSASLPWLNNLLDQPTSLVVNPPFLSIEHRDFQPVNLGLGVYGSVPCDLPKEVVRDALAISLGSQSSASFSGAGLNDCDHSKNVWPIVARSNVKDAETSLAVDFSYMQS